MLGSRRSVLPVLDADGRVVGAITADSLRGISPDEYGTKTVADLATSELPRIDASTGAFDDLVELDSGRSDVVLVERYGSLAGVISRADYNVALSLRRGQEPF